MLCRSGTLLTFLTEGPFSGGFERQCDGQTGPATLGVGGAHAAVVRDDDLLDEGQAKAGAAGLGREKRPENPLDATAGSTPGPLSDTLTRSVPGPSVAPFDDDAGRDPRRCTPRARCGTSC